MHKAIKKGITEIRDCRRHDNKKMGKETRKNICICHTAVVLTIDTCI
jgi:hypothetical protein